MVHPSRSSPAPVRSRPACWSPAPARCQDGRPGRWRWPRPSRRSPGPGRAAA